MAFGLLSLARALRTIGLVMAGGPRDAFSPSRGAAELV
jgi:hypothetical protein